MSNHASAAIEARLEMVRRAIRRAQALRGALVVATVAVGGLLLMMAADLLLPPIPEALRWTMLGLWLLAIVLAARFGFRPLWRKISLVQVARWIEIRHPEMEERLSTVLEIGRSGGVSESLVEALSRAAGEDAGTVDPQAELAAVRTTGRWARPAVAVVAVLAIAFIAWPAETARLLVRAVLPNSDTGNAGAGKFTLKPGTIEVLAGDRVELEVAYAGAVEQVELWLEFEDGPPILQTLGGDAGMFRYVLDPARNSFRYRARAGRAESDAYQVTVWPLPAIAEPSVLLEFPSYTGALPEEGPLGRRVEALAGTRVTIGGDLNTPVEAAWIQLGERRVAEVAASDGRLALSWTLDAGGSGEATLVLRHRLGREIQALDFTVAVMEDRAPEVVVLSPVEKELRVRPDEIVTVRYEASDDHSIAGIALEVAAGGKSGLFDQPMPTRLPDTRPPRFRDSLELAVGALRAEFGGREIRLRLVAEDVRPAELGGPGRGYSEWLTLRIDDGAESLVRQELREQQQGARDRVEEAVRAAREARDQLERQRGEVRKDEISQEARRQLEEAAAKLADTREALEELARQMDEGIQAAKADDVREAAEALDAARQEAEEVALQDSAAEREAMLEAAREQADEAVAQLEAIREAIDHDRERVDDLARIAELAQQQRELARQAEANHAERPDQVPDEWREQQRRMEEALRQQLRERPEARAEALQAQAEAARGLAEEARETAAAQEDLRQQAEQQVAASEASAEAVNALREALVEAQAQIVEEARQQDDSAPDGAPGLPEAIAAGEQAMAALESGELDAAAAAAEMAAEALASASQEVAPGEPEAGQAEQGQAEAGQAEQGQAEQGQAEAGQAEAGMAEQGQAEQGQAEQGQAESGQAESGQAEQGQAEQGQAEQGQAESGQAEAGQAEQGQAESGQAESGQAEAGQAEQGQAEAGQAESGQAESGQAEQGQAEQGQAEQGQAESGQAEQGQAEAGQAEQGQGQAEPGAMESAADQGQAAMAEHAEAVSQLAERQAQLAEAIAALAGEPAAEALLEQQEAGAEAAGELAQAVQALPQFEFNGALQDAKNAGRTGSEQAAAAAAQAADGSQQQAAAAHQRSGREFENAANALDLAAEEFGRAAAEAANQSPNPQRAEVPGEDLAEAFQQAARAAADERSAAAAEQAANAADALAQASEAAMQAMRGPSSSGPPGEPGSRPGSEPGDEPQEGPRPQQADPGVPPALAKLGISASDWEKIQASLRSDVGAREADTVPAEYRDLVRGYFENISKAGSE